MFQVTQLLIYRDLCSFFFGFVFVCSLPYGNILVMIWIDIKNVLLLNI